MGKLYNNVQQPQISFGHSEKYKLRANSTKTKEKQQQKQKKHRQEEEEGGLKKGRGLEEVDVQEEATEVAAQVEVEAVVDC